MRSRGYDRPLRFPRYLANTRTLSLPFFMTSNSLLRSNLVVIFFEKLRQSRTRVALTDGPEHRRVPPDHAMLAHSWQVHAWSHGAPWSSSILQTPNYIVISKLRTTRRLHCLWLEAGFLWRIEHRVKCRQPSFVCVVSHSTNHQKISRPSGSHIKHSCRLFFFDPHLFFSIFLDFDRSAARKPHSTQSCCLIDPLGRLARVFRRNVDQHHNRKLKAFRFMHRHDANAVDSLFHDRCVTDIPALSFFIKPVDKRSERDYSIAFHSARHVRQSHDVRECLFTSRPVGKSGMSTRKGQQRSDSL